MDYTRREFGKLALAALPAAALLETPLFGSALAQAKPNSLINGVQIGTITYSFRQMPDQSAEATLKYVLESGISAIELMGGPVDAYARAKSGFTPSVAGGRGGGGAAGAGGRGRPGGAGAAAAGAAAAAEPMVAPPGSWNGQPCPAGRAGGAGGGGRAAAPAAEAGAAAGAVAAPRGGGGGGRGPQTPEQQAAAEEVRKWRSGLSMSIFKDLRKMYNDAGVSIYAVKNLTVNGTDEELEFEFAVAEALGANHVTAELPSGPNAAATLKRVGDWALKKKIYAAYHTHAQGNITVFDEAFAASPGNRANVDFGHYVAGGGGNPVLFLEKFHDRISSFHLKDRTTPEHCALNLPWGTGETPIKEILQTVKKNKWKMPASIELEYTIPEGSDSVKEVQKCLAYCRAALA